MTLSPGPKVQPKRSTRDLARRVQRLLQLDVERPRPEPAAVHRAEHLDVAHRVEPEAARDALAHQRQQLRHPGLRVGRVHEVEVRALLGGEVRHLPWLIRWALVTIRLPAAWRNTSVRRTTGTAPEAMMSASTCPGPTEGSWSTSPTSSSAAPLGQRPAAARASAARPPCEVSSTTSRSQSSGFGSPRLKPPFFGSTSSRRWMVRRLPPGALGQALGGAAGRRAERDPAPLAASDLQDRVDQGRLADARAAGDHQHLGGERQAHRLALARGQGQAGLLLHPGDRLARRRSPARAARRRRGARSRSAIACSARYRPARKTQRSPVQRVGDHLAGLAAPGRARSRSAPPAPRAARAASAISSSAGRPQWPSLHGLGQREGDAGAHPDHAPCARCRACAAIWSAVRKPMPRMSRASR